MMSSVRSGILSLVGCATPLAESVKSAQIVVMETDPGLESAKSSLNAAGQVVPESNEGFAIETDMFMDSISAQIDTETALQEMRTKSGGSGAEIEQLKKERDALFYAGG